MKRLFICLVLPFLLSSCEQAKPDVQEEYNFNDGYYLYQGKKIYLTPVEDEYTIVFKAEDQNEVLDYLEKNGWEILFDGPYGTPDQTHYDFDVPDYVKSSVSAQIKGSGNVGMIPHVYFFINAHMLQDGIQPVYLSNSISVKYHDEESYGDRLSEALEYAQQLKIVPVRISDLVSSKYVKFICTNESAGNPLELANWFCEEKGFTSAEPGFVEQWDSSWD